mmetsp:Transcript_23471/g.59942  ORF Transcript_23471/g.59942 Transcript_23471/m.59942 type:complete len:427 (-) Transcript_23471:784-2064(-)
MPSCGYHACSVALLRPFVAGKELKPFIQCLVCDTRWWHGLQALLSTHLRRCPPDSGAVTQRRGATLAVHLALKIHAVSIGKLKDLRPQRGRICAIYDAKLPATQHVLELVGIEGCDARDEQELGELRVAFTDDLGCLQGIHAAQTRGPDGQTKFGGGPSLRRARKPHQPVGIYLKSLANQLAVAAKVDATARLALGVELHQVGSRPIEHSGDDRAIGQLVQCDDQGLVHELVGQKKAVGHTPGAQHGANGYGAALRRLRLACSLPCCRIHHARGHLADRGGLCRRDPRLIGLLLNLCRRERRGFKTDAVPLETLGGGGGLLLFMLVISQLCLYAGELLLEGSDLILNRLIGRHLGRTVVAARRRGPRKVGRDTRPPRQQVHAAPFPKHPVFERAACAIDLISAANGTHEFSPSGQSVARHHPRRQG